MMKVCLVAPVAPPYGGISNWTSLITGHAPKTGAADLVVVNTAPRWRPIYKVGVIRRGIGGAAQLLRDLMRLAEAVYRARVDVVHLTTTGQLAAVRDIAVAYLCKACGIRFIYHVRFGRIPTIAAEGSIEWMLIRHVMHRASTVIVIDESTFRAARTFAPRAKTLLVPNCVDFSRLPEPKAGDASHRIALFIGWIIPTKGIEELIASWALLKPSGWSLQIIGPGDINYQRELLDRYKPAAVEFCGEKSHADAMDALSKADLMVLPSYTEGFPNVVVEAMALRKAIVATKVGAIPEMLSNDAGVIVEPREVDSLMRGLELVLYDTHLRSKLGERAQSRARELYSIDSVFQSYCQIWQEASISRK